ncbi:hypothetical protein AGABI2DRAFT_200525 [Agaricus bisporus var. bisporus H97]|uniref:hypothetical protein n=1 Tax=Agaricus bisporus var. bisporus (strain H97 / ATCC MYA-4626 / FGSC 10389) TaxID=936046 RepID=UPI00029F675E|nr:hypothetical protein AGABI2DRAFT_200525 [Agaricus bisporus var. bisporus H97]EKV50663.1 hypothetical protein AGABI2DRAFT_200525 [Agaricus bisporus var. bisporus H97]
MWPFSSTSYPNVAFDRLHTKYDYIIVGGGTAGCVLANRLSANPETTVLLIERGPVGDTWLSRIPLASMSYGSEGTFCRLQKSEYHQELNKGFGLIRGSGLGGTSRINGMLYSRGLPKEYDFWAESGCEGWGWKEVERFFRKSENFLDGEDHDNVHGKMGEWTNRRDHLYFPPFSRVVEACKSLGIFHSEDLNSPKNPTNCIGQGQFTRDRKQYRNSTNRAFLPAELVRARANLHIVTNAIGGKLIIGQRDATPFVEGVEIIDRFRTKKKVVMCGCEVIVCAGAFGTPQVLMLSGIGPAEHLKEHDIPVHKNLPAVGNNLQDHFGVSTAFRVPMGHSLLSVEKQPWTMVIQILLWLIWGTGMLLCPVIQTYITMSSASLDARGIPFKDKGEVDALPDIEIAPIAYETCELELDKSRGFFSLLSIVMRPKSRGRVCLASTQADAPMKIYCNYLSNPEDFIPLRAALKLSLRISEKMREDGYPIEDWKTALPQGEDDESLDKFIRRRNMSTYHYTSTCRMGSRQDAPDGGAAVDPQLRVFGVGGLRVADASVFPWVVAAHPQAAVVMTAEKCADMILHPKQE